METPKKKINWNVWISLGAFAFLVWFIIEKITYPMLPQTPEVVQLQRDAAQGDANAKQRLDSMRSEMASEHAFLCHLKSVCAKYGPVRQDCATAGNFDTCVGIKMGDSDKDLIGSCSSDGYIAIPRTDMPGSAECWIRNLNR